jgi:hypothetical protein
VSIVEMTRTIRAHATPSPRAPYVSGDRIRATDPEGSQYLGKVSTVEALADGTFSVLAELREPRHLRGHVLTVVVDEDGRGQGVEPYGR